MKMKTKALTGVLASILFILFNSYAVHAHSSDKNPSVKRQMLSIDSLSNIAGHTLKSLIIELAPNVSVGEHKHEGFIYAYVLEGRVRSQLNKGKIVEYEKGDSWVEPPLILHTLTQNASDKEPAKLLVLFIAKDGARLILPDVTK